MTAATVAVTCADCGLTDHTSNPALSGVRRHPLADRLLCGRCTAKLYPVVERVPSATPPKGLAPWHPTPDTTLQSQNGGVPHGGTRGTLRRCDIGNMLTTEPEPVDWLVGGVVARGTLTLLAAREKEGKSLLSLGFGARMAQGGGQLAGIDCQAGRVLVVDAENGDREIHRRVRSLGLDSSAAGRLEVFEARGFHLGHHLAVLEEVLADVQPDLLVLDSWRSLWTGEENDSGEVSAILDPLRDLIRDRNVGAVLIHHMRKGGGYRGSSAVGASVENIVELARHDEDPDRRRRRLRNPACRYEQEADDRWVRIEADRQRGLLLIDACEPFVPEHGQQRAGMKERLLGALNGDPSSWSAWARSADVDPKHGTARRARDELIAAGHVESKGGAYRAIEASTSVTGPGVA